MKKDITAITIITILSAIAVPITCSIFGVSFPNEVFELPHDLPSLGQFANLLICAFGTGLALGLIGLLLYFKALKRIYFVCLYLLTILIIIIDVFCLAKFGLAISPPMVSIMSDTNNTTEIAGFFETYFDAATGAFILLLSLASWSIWHYSQNIYDFTVKHKKAFVGIIITLVAIAHFFGHKIGGMTASAPINKTWYCVRYWYKVKNTIAKMSSDKTNRVELLDNKSDTPYFVFIIGESESKHFMGLYNSKYNTTPLCQKLKDSENLFVFTDVISMKSSTAQVMTPLLSFMENTTETIDVSRFDPIVDVFTKAGYQAFWLSNHEKMTKDLSYATYMSNRCDYATFTSKTPGNSEYTPWLCTKDEALLPPLDNYLQKEALQKNKNLFILQIMGSHIRYRDRYPDTYKRFKEEDIWEEGFRQEQKALLAEYLNTIYYTDFVLNEIITRFKDKDAIVVYVSDHAEEMWQSGFQGHGPTNISKYMVEIPMLIWTSDQYKENRPAKLEQIKNSLNKPFMTDNLVHVLLDLAGITTRQYNPQKSLINSSYIPAERVINGIKYEDLRK